MGCASSKQTAAVATPTVVYRPPPSSFAVFDINSIEEPWLKFDNSHLHHFKDHDNDKKKQASLLPPPLLDSLDDAPCSWDEVSKALHELNNNNNSNKPDPIPTPKSTTSPPSSKDSLSIHTVDDLDPKKPPPPPVPVQNDQITPTRLKKTTPQAEPPLSVPAPDQAPAGFRSVKANPFIMRDRIEREKEGKEAAFDKIMKAKRDPLSEYPEVCPPGGAYQVVLYTTSLGGVRRTFEDCNRVRAILEYHRVVFDERDVSLHGEFLTELRDLVGSTAVPRLFVKGRSLGEADEVVEMNESGRLGRIFSTAGVERGPGWQGCEGCGGARFMPCFDCGGSCKVVVGDGHDKERCPKCNENGLVHCPRCH